MAEAEMTTAARERLVREKRTIETMVEMYCRAHHHPETGLCPDCLALLSYALQRIEGCPFRLDKPTCAKCPIHCYKPTMRERIRQVMRYAGPRMMFCHPLLAIRHHLDGKREPGKAAVLEAEEP